MSTPRRTQTAWFIGGALAALALVGVLAGAVWMVRLFASASAPGPDALAVPPGSEALAQCPAPKSPVPIADLSATEQLSGCNPKGAFLLLPNGQTVEVPTVGAILYNDQDPDGNRWLLTNWGVPGVGVVWSTDTGTQIWGTSPDAVDREARAWAYSLEHRDS